MIQLFVILCALLAAFLSISYYTYRIAFHSSPSRRADPFDLPRSRQYDPYRRESRERVSRFLTEEYEAAQVVSFDGLKLTGKYYHRFDGGPVAICIHGWRSTSIRDFSGGAPVLMKLGWNVLLVDQRAQGQSEGCAMTFGVKERRDCLAWVNWVLKRCGADAQIALYGVSMGAATVLMATGLELPENVRCVVADSPYSSPAKIIRKVCRDRNIQPALAWPFIYAGARLFARFDPAEATAADEVRRARIPILVIHGSDDRFVPCEMSEEIAAANPLVERHVFEGAAHGVSFLADQPRYEALIRDFTRRAL